VNARRFFRKLTGRKVIGGLYELSSPLLRDAILRAIDATGKPLSGDHLDVGSGGGQLLRLVASRYPVNSFACDYTDRLMETPGQTVEIADLNHQSLPYTANRFALVTCVETIEHLENFRAMVREIFRVLKPGGLAVISTPNVLNLRSRMRYLFSGFYNLFGPLVPEESKVHGPRGHITPVNWFYLAHSLLSTGFPDLRLSVDKYQRRSWPIFVLLVWPIHLASRIIYWRDRKHRTLNEKNVSAVHLMNSRDLLLGRTLIVTASKPS
jgi:SAM-dependent methyltransferase